MQIKEEYLEELAFLEMKEIEQEIKSILSASYDKPYILDSRVKSLEKIHLKQLYREERNEPSDILDVPDIIGFRISVDSEEEVIEIFSLINSYFEPKRVVDFFNYPKSTGYQAFNCFYDIWGLNTEIQIMTKEMREWTNNTHDEHNQRKYENVLNRTRELPKE